MSATIGVRLSTMLTSRGSSGSAMATRPTTIKYSTLGFGLSGLFELFCYSTIFLPAKAGPFFFNPVTFIPVSRQRCAVIMTSVAPSQEGADKYPRLRVRPSFPDAVNALISPPPFPLSSVSLCLCGQPSSFNHSCLLVLISGFNPDIFLRALRALRVSA